MTTEPDIEAPSGAASSAISQPYSSRLPRRCNGTLAAALLQNSAGYLRSDTVSKRPSATATTDTPCCGVVGRQLASERLDRRAGRARVGHRWHPVMRRDRHVDDCAGARIAHRELVRRRGHRERPVDVEAVNGPPALRGEALGRDHVLAAGVVEQEIDAPEELDRRVHDLLRAGRVADVGGHPRAPLTDLGRRLLEQVGAPSRDHDRRTAAHELLRRAPAEVRSAPGDDRDAPFERAVDEDARGRHPTPPEP